MEQPKKWISLNSVNSVFFLVVYTLVALFFCIPQGYGPSMDGPSHFYNSFLLKEYFLGNPEVRLNFTLTPFYNPNLFSTYFIAFLYVFFSYKIVAFIFFFLYFLFSFYSTLFLVKSYNIRLAQVISLCMVLFFNSTLLNLGFYNFSWSVIFLFFTIAYFRNYISQGKTAFKSWIIYMFLLILTYYSNALTFIFYLLYLLAFGAVNVRSENNTGLKEYLKKMLSFLVKNLLMLLPFLVLLICFYVKSPLNQAAAPNDPKTYNELLTDMSSLIAYGSSEKEYTHILFFGFLAWFVLALVIRITKKELIRSGDFFLLLAGIMLAAFYLVPDNSGVGMMSVRFQHFFYLFLLIWLVLQKYWGVTIIGVAFVLYFSMQKFRYIHKDILISLSENARAINASAKFIEPGSSVTSFNYAENWLTLHFSNYLGIEKPLIITDNYEANVGWFPLTWNYNKAPVYTFNDKELTPANNEANREKQRVKYVMVFGNINAFRADSVKFKVVSENYNKVYESEHSYVVLYKLK